MFNPKKIIFSYIIFIINLAIFSEEISERKDPAVYYVKVKTSIKNIDLNLTKIIMILPLPQTNEYQDVEILNVYNGQILDIKESNDKYLRFILEGNDLPLKNSKREIIYEFKVTLNSIKTNFDKIKYVYPYDTSSDIYKSYTQSNEEYIDLNNNKIKSMGDKLWGKSEDYLDYARNCYEYVARKFKYLNPGTGLHSVEKILSDGGGDCGNLSLVFVNLLRYKGIPARLLVGKIKHNSSHAWADFYLENYGWIPVDVTYKNSMIYNDYFGVIPGNRLILSKGNNLNLEIEKGNFINIDILQNYRFWRWFSGGNKELKIDFKYDYKKLN